MFQLDQHQLDVFTIGGKHELATGRQVVRGFDPGAGQQRQGLIENPPLGERYGYFLDHGTQLGTRWICAPRLASFSSI